MILKSVIFATAEAPTSVESALSCVYPQPCVSTRTSLHVGDVIIPAAIVNMTIATITNLFILCKEYTLHLRLV